MPTGRRFVYIIKSVTTPDEYYVGVTSDVALRLRDHNAGLSRHTSHHRPWRTLVVVEFDEQGPALKFERYLKSGSGREFARRHFRQTVGSGEARKGPRCSARSSSKMKSTAP
jgi:predicted GIY-YIG superfamily endonuclease